MQTDIFYVSRKSDHILTVLDADPKIKNLKKLKPKQKNEFTIYVFNNLNLIVNNKNKSRVCLKIENIESVVCNDYIFQVSKVIRMPLESFPIINSYDNIINRTITTYENNMCLIDEGDVLYMRVDNDIGITSQLFDKLN